MSDPSLPDRRPFLSARWERLCLITYAVDPKRLAPLLHPELELDTIDGQAFVSEESQASGCLLSVERREDQVRDSPDHGETVALVCLSPRRVYRQAVWAYDGFESAEK